MQLLRVVNKPVGGVMLAASLLFGVHNSTSSLWSEKQASKSDIHGIPLKDVNVTTDTLSEPSTLQQLFSEVGIDDTNQILLSKRLEINEILPNGTEYRVYRKYGSTKYLIYDLPEGLYRVITLGKRPSIATGVYEAKIEKKAIVGRVSNNMFQTVNQLGMERQFVDKLAEIFAWEIDFHKLGPDDTFKTIYQEKRRNGVKVGNGKIIAASFTHENQTFHAFYFEHAGLYGYFDEQGNPVEKSYLQAPLDFSYITSKYSKSRFHPVLKEYIPHLGTDYAAPSGTPVKAVGSGTIELAGASGKNGLYIKIRHDNTYATGYLHLSKVAENISSGKVVNQGDIIGYVGSTGLATGPHLCFRFWKNGKQVDPFSEKHTRNSRINKEILPIFKEEADRLKNMLDNLNIEERDENFFVLNV